MKGAYMKRFELAGKSALGVACILALTLLLGWFIGRYLFDDPGSQHVYATDYPGPLVEQLYAEQIVDVKAGDIEIVSRSSWKDDETIPKYGPPDYELHVKGATSSLNTLKDFADDGSTLISEIGFEEDCRIFIVDIKAENLS